MFSCVFSPDARTSLLRSGLAAPEDTYRRKVTHMHHPLNVAVMGAAGRMGERIITLIGQSKDITLGAAIERPDHPRLGQELESHGTRVRLMSDLNEALTRVEVAIDFTSAQQSLATAPIVAEHRKPLVIGSTGFSPLQTEELKKCVQDIPCVLSPNMSMGVNLLFKLVNLVARVLKDAYDVEIVEAHHRLKKDAPSGTALRLAEAVAEGLHRDLGQAGVYGRKGLVGERTPEEIGIHAVRAGDIVGEHTVLFAGTGERLELTHRAHSRDTFAQGALKAAQWVQGRPPGLYSMEDVLGLRD